MTDIDFDELDKAVMSLMKNVKPDNEAEIEEGTTKEKVVALTTSDSKPTIELPSQPPAAATPLATPAPGAVQSFRRSGRIMDVAKTTSAPQVPARRISRQAVDITPPSSTISDVIVPPVKKAPDTEKPDSTQVEQSPEVPASVDTTPPSVSSSFPDPIDFHANPQPDEDESVTDEVAADPVEPDPVVSAPQPAAEASDYTPFIPDAKVEKRPLGTPSVPVQNQAQPQKSDPGETSSTPRDHTNTEPEPATSTPAPELPDELDTDLVAIESGAAANIEHDSDDEVPEKKDVTESRPAGPGDRFAGQVQIPQQYHTVANDTTPEHVPIYDTATLHQPLAHPAKKPAGWLWVIGILGVILLGAGVAAALYYLHVF